MSEPINYGEEVKKIFVLFIITFIVIMAVYAISATSFGPGSGGFGFNSPEKSHVYYNNVDAHEIACREETPWLDAAQHGFEGRGVQGRDSALIEYCPPSRGYVYSKSGKPNKICRLEWEESSSIGYEFQGLKPRASYTIEDCG